MLDAGSSFPLLTLKLPGLHSPLEGWSLWLLQHHPVPAVSRPLPQVIPCLLSPSVLPKTVHLPQSNSVCCCLLVLYTFMCLYKAVPLNQQLRHSCAFLRVAAELWAELTRSFCPALSTGSTRFMDFLGSTAKEKRELVAVLFPASLSQRGLLSLSPQ